MKNSITKRSVLLLCALTTFCQADDLAYGIARGQWTHMNDADLDGGGDVNYDRLLLQTALSKPIPLFSGVQMVPTFRYTYTDLTAQFGADERQLDLHQIELPTNFFRKLEGTPWMLTMNLTPGIASDFEEVNGDDFFLDARIGGEYEFSDTFSLNFGVAYTRMTGEPGVIPFLGFAWEPCDAWKLSLYGPKFDVRYTIHEDWRVRLSAQPGGGLWNIDGDNGNPSRYLDFTSYHVGLNVEKRLRDNLWIYAGAGVAMLNELETSDSSHDKLFGQDADDSIYYQIGLRLGEW